MLKRERQNKILDIIKERKYCTVALLAKRLYVSPITIRRDLAEMESNSLISRCYGGATIPEHENREIPFEVRNSNSFLIKKELSKIASKKIKTGDVVFIDASSTMSHIVEFLSPEQDLTIVTNSPLLEQKFKEKHIKCYLTGGISAENSYALTGSIAEQTISNFYANICFFSAQGIDEDGNITDQSESETALRKLMVKHAKKQYFVFDDSKFGKRFAFKLCSSNDITGVISNL